MCELRRRKFPFRASERWIRRGDLQQVQHGPLSYSLREMWRADSSVEIYAGRVSEHSCGSKGWVLHRDRIIRERLHRGGKLTRVTRSGSPENLSWHGFRQCLLPSFAKNHSGNAKID